MNEYPAKTVIAGPAMWKCGKCKAIHETRKCAHECCDPQFKFDDDYKTYKMSKVKP